MHGTMRSGASHDVAGPIVDDLLDRPTRFRPKSVTVTALDGQTHILAVFSDRSLMQIISAAGIDECMTICGGCHSCGQCHVVIDPASFAKLPAMEVDEHDLLERSEHMTETSRLSCRIILSEDLAGLTAIIAPAE